MLDHRKFHERLELLSSADHADIDSHPGLQATSPSIMWFPTSQMQSPEMWIWPVQERVGCLSPHMNRLLSSTGFAACCRSVQAPGSSGFMRKDVIQQLEWLTQNLVEGHQLFLWLYAGTVRAIWHCPGILAAMPSGFLLSSLKGTFFLFYCCKVDNSVRAVHLIQVFGQQTMKMLHRYFNEVSKMDRAWALCLWTSSGHTDDKAWVSDALELL